MKKILSLVLALALLLSVSAAMAEGGLLAKIKEKGEITMATSPDYPPYEFPDKEGKIVGADVQLAEYIAKKLGVKLVIDSMDFDTSLAAVAAGKVNFSLAGIDPTEERKTLMDFSDVYYNEGDETLVILKENADKYKTLEDFTGKTVAAQNGTVQQKLVENELPKAKYEPVVKIPDGVMMVLSKKVDGIVLASVVADQYIANYPDLVKSEVKLNFESLGIAAAVVKNEPELLKAINEAIAEVIEQKLYFTWIEDAVALNNSLQK